MMSSFSVVLFCLTAVLCSTAVLSSPKATTTASPTTIAPSNICAICKEIVGEARDSLTSNLTISEMKQVFEGTCRILIPIKSVAKLCMKYADELVPELIDTLATEMNPTTVCVTSGLCVADSFSKVLKSFKYMNARFSLRAAAVLAKHDVASLVKISESVKLSDKRIQNLLKGMCNLLPGRKHTGECVDAVALYYPVVKTVLLTTVKNSDNCNLCELVVQYAENEITSSSFEQDIENYILPLCNYTGSYKDECRAFILQYFPKLWNLLLNQIKAKTLCTDIGLCDSVKAPKIISKPVKSEECDICKALFAEAKAELMSDEAMNLAKSAVIELCDICPEKDKCTSYLNTNFAQFYKEAIGMIEPTAICTALGVCSASKIDLVPASAEDPNVMVFSKMPEKLKEPVLHRIALKKEFNNYHQLTATSGNVLECTACKYLVHYIQEEVVKNASISHIETALHQICKKLPEISSECDAFIDTYAPAIAALIAQEIDPSYVCYKLINVCSTRAEMAPAAPIKEIDWNECSVCTLAVDYLSELLQNDKLDTDLTKIIEQVCELMPKSAYEECVAVISTYGPSVMHLIGELANSRQICEKITLCQTPELLGKEKCTYGPAYWCKDVATAHMCNAYEHCLSTWKK